MMPESINSSQPEAELVQQCTIPTQPETDPAQQFTTLNQPAVASTEMVPFPDFVDVNNQSEDAMAQEFFSADVQAQLPSMSAVTAAANTAATVPAETPKGKKKAQPRKRKSTAKGKAKANVHANAQAQQMGDPSYGFNQVMDADPFISSSSQQCATNRALGMLDGSMPIMAVSAQMTNSMQQQTEQFPVLAQPTTGFVAMELPTEQPVAAQTSSGAAETMVQQAEEVPMAFDMFMKQSGGTPPSASPADMCTPALALAAGHPPATPSSDNKRRAPASRGAETPTKRRQSVNSQGAIIPIPQDAPEVPPIPANHTPARNSSQRPAPIFQTPQQPQIPLDPALHFGVSPPSGRGMPFGTAIKAGICAVIKAILKEAKKRGTVLDQLLAHGPQTAFTAPETTAHIKQVARGHLAEVHAQGPESDNEAFNSGAYKVLQAVVQEIEQRGSVFGKELFLGPVSGPELAGVKRAMVKMYKEVSASYVSPPRVIESPGAPGQVQQTPTRAAANANKNGVANNTSISAAGPHLQGQHPSPGSSAMAQPAAQQPAPPALASAEQALIPNFSHPLPPKKSPARKSRARKSSMAIITARQPTVEPSTTKPSSSSPSSGQYKPRLSYSFSDRCFYMHPSMDGSGEEGKHKVGAGTASAQASLTQFLEAARAQLGVSACPRGFVYRQWLGMDGNVEALRKALAGQEVMNA
ncbi:hypothetical protein VTI74DRAFT_6612 [Chaetomium olivicolor]